MGKARFSPALRATTAFIALACVLTAGGMSMLIAKAAHHELPAPPVIAKSPRVVSLLPQATDILVSMGCGDHLVAVSNFDADPTVASLPRVGDYHTTDWEAIAALSPDRIITHYGGRGTPIGFTEHAAATGARQVNLITETLNGPDPKTTIYHAIDVLGEACNEPAKAAAASARLRSRLEAIRQRVADKKPVPALIVIGSEGTMVAGKDTYLTELLELAGGVNVASDMRGRYPIIDREQLLALQPAVIFQLLPGAPPQVFDQAKHAWAALSNLPAVRDGRIVPMTAWYVMLPGYHVGDMAEQFAAALHPEGAR